MYVIGYIAAILAAIIVLFVLTLVVLSLSDFRRYMQIRRM
jgi:energy-converting hydrogenase Eha subunit A